MSGIITGVPVPFVIVLQGEAVGIPEGALAERLLGNLSFTAWMTSCNRGMSIAVGSDAKAILTSQRHPRS